MRSLMTYITDLNHDACKNRMMMAFLKIMTVIRANSNYKRLLDSV